jgi:hypothetical protein
MYRTIESSIYADPKIKKLPSDGKFLFVYLLTNEMTDFTGLYHAPYILVASQTGISVKRLKDILDIYEDLGIALHDDEAETIWVVNMMKYQLRSHKTMKKVMHHLKGLHAPVLILQFLHYYRQDLEAYAEGYDEMLAKYTETCLTVYGYVYPETAIRVSRKPDTEVEKADTSTVPVPVPGSVPGSSPGSKIEETKDTARPQQRFSDDPQHLVDLWNAKAPKELHRVHTVSAGMRVLIKKALKEYPERRFWEEILQEYERSDFLRNGNFAHFDWLLKTSKGESVENFIKVKNGNYRDKHDTGMSELTRKNLKAAEQAMARFNLPTKARVAITEGIKDGYTVDGHHNGTSGPDGHSLWHDADAREDRDLPGEPSGVYGEAGDQRDDVGGEESDPLSDDRGLADPDRGE